MLDPFNREISYLRISVTDRCNLRCKYCMPAEGIQLMRHEDILSLEEITEVVKVAASKFGIRQVRLTGGEPLIRKGIVDLVKMIRQVPEIDEINMTTNGIYLQKYAQDLKEAGLTRVNISLDTIDAKKYESLTRGGDIEQVKGGVLAAKKAGLTPVKINVVRPKDHDVEDLENVKDYCDKEGLEIRYINMMDLETGSFSQVEGGAGGNCKKCKRLRLMANGNVKPCLFSDLSYNVRELGTENAFLKALNMKPERGNVSQSHSFYNIGG